MYAFTAAHKTLPLPSFARVTNLDNGKSVIVRVNDRGPFHDGRVIDLSYAAAVKLGVDRTGTARVEVRALASGRCARRPAAPPTTRRRPLPAGRSAADHPARSIGWSSAMPVASAVGSRARAASRQARDDAPTPPPPRRADYRFDMSQDGKAMSAENSSLDAVAAGARRHRQAGRARARSQPRRRVETARRAASRQRPASAGAPCSRRRTSGDGDVILQVASFGARSNADRAWHAQGAGIDEARLFDGEANGQKVWRLRVGPVAGRRGAGTRRAHRRSGFGSRSACATRTSARAPAPQDVRRIAPDLSRHASPACPRIRLSQNSRPTHAARPRSPLATCRRSALPLAQTPRRARARRARRRRELPVPPPPGAHRRKAWLLMDYATGQVLAGENIDTRMEPASITKVMTCYVIAAEMKNGKVKANDLVMMSEHAWREGGAGTEGSYSGFELNSRTADRHGKGHGRCSRATTPRSRSPSTSPAAWTPSPR